MTRLLGEQQQDRMQDVTAFAASSALGTPGPTASSAPGVLAIRATTMTAVTMAAVRPTSLFGLLRRRGRR